MSPEYVDLKNAINRIDDVLCDLRINSAQAFDIGMREVTEELDKDIDALTDAQYVLKRLLDINVKIGYNE
jgi:hypothetical protein